MPKCVSKSIFIEITLWYGCSAINLLPIYRKPFPKNTSGGLFLKLLLKKNNNGSCTPVTFKMELFVTLVNSFQPLNIVKKRSQTRF